MGWPDGEMMLERERKVVHGTQAHGRPCDARRATTHDGKAASWAAVGGPTRAERVSLTQGPSPQACGAPQASAVHGNCDPEQAPLVLMP